MFISNPRDRTPLPGEASKGPDVLCQATLILHQARGTTRAAGPCLPCSWNCGDHNGQKEHDGTSQGQTYSSTTYPHPIHGLSPHQTSSPTVTHLLPQQEFYTHQLKPIHSCSVALQPDAPSHAQAAMGGEGGPKGARPQPQKTMREPPPPAKSTSPPASSSNSQASRAESCSCIS